LNKATNRKFDITKGNYLRLIPLELMTKEKQDLYLGNLHAEDAIILNLNNEDYKYIIQGNVFKILFNKMNYYYGQLIIINREDYRAIKDQQGIEIGKIQLISFKDWKKTKGIVSELDVTMKSYNETTPKINELEPENVYKVASKIETYNYNKQGGTLMFYLITFIGIFFFIASCVILFLRLFSEIDNDKTKYKKFYKLGITEKEIRNNIASELRVLFFIAPIIGIAIAFIYTNVFFKSSEFAFNAFICDLVISGIYLCFQTFYYFVSKKMYGNEIIKSLE
jgi:ABC-type antimicrobial peptide transport system permease subunit